MWILTDNTFSIAIFLLVSSPNSASSRILRIFFFCLRLVLVQKEAWGELDFILETAKTLWDNSFWGDKQHISEQSESHSSVFE